jgi:hypothetical protein
MQFLIIKKINEKNVHGFSQAPMGLKKWKHKMIDYILIIF